MVDLAGTARWSSTSLSSFMRRKYFNRCFKHTNTYNLKAMKIITLLVFFTNASKKGNLSTWNSSSSVSFGSSSFASSVLVVGSGGAGLGQAAAILQHNRWHSEHAQLHSQVKWSITCAFLHALSVIEGKLQQKMAAGWNFQLIWHNEIWIPALECVIESSSNQDLLTSVWRALSCRASGAQSGLGHPIQGCRALCRQRSEGRDPNSDSHQWWSKLSN